MTSESGKTIDQGHGPADLASIWGTPLTAIHCTQCERLHLVAGPDVPARCPYCAQASITVEPIYPRGESPEMLVPYAVSERNLDTILGRWAQGVPFRPADMDTRALSGRAARYMIPVWLVDGRVLGVWRADIGFDYQAVSYQDRYREGAGWQSRQVQETRTRWEPRMGQVDRRYENLPTPALDGHQQLMKRLGSFDLSQRAEYRPEHVQQSVISAPSRTPEAARPEAEAALARACESDCLQAAGADHIRDFALEAAFGELHWTLLLLPAYVTWYREGEHDWPVMVNGQNGRVSGVKRASTKKATTVSLVLGGIALLLFVLGGSLALLGAVFPPGGAAGAVLLVLGVVTAIGAPIPAIAAWTHNGRSELEDWL